MHRLLTSLALSVALSHTLAAQHQSLASLPSGSRVRLTYRPVSTDSGAIVPRPIVGRYVSQDAASLYVIPRADTASGRYALSALQRVEYVSSSHRPRVRALIVGTLAGVAIGSLVGVVRTKQDVTYCNQKACPTPEIHSQRESGRHGAVFGAGVGFGLGLLGGSIITIDRWTRLELR